MSRAVMLYELEEIQKEIEKYENPPQNLLQLKEDIQLSLKLMKLKLKRPNQKKGKVLNMVFTTIYRIFTKIGNFLF